MAQPWPLSLSKPCSRHSAASTDAPEMTAEHSEKLGRLPYSSLEIQVFINPLKCFSQRTR